MSVHTPMDGEVDEELASIIQHISIDDQPSNGHADIILSEAEGEAGGATMFPPIDHGTTSPLTPTDPSPEPDQGVPGDISELLGRVRAASRRVSSLLDQIYEIQELRHASDSSTSANTSSPSSNKLDILLSSVSNTVTLLRPEITSLQPAAAAATAAAPSASASEKDAVVEGIQELLGEWKGAEEQHAMLKEEMKEDGWLVRFRATADQAEAMIDPLQKSYAECSRYVERLSSSPIRGAYPSSFDEPSVEGMEKLARSHDAMTKTYAPSIVKILKMIDRSISDRPIKNGEALRRFGEMMHRWQTLQKQLQQLDARIRLIFSQYQSDMGESHSPGEIEILADISPYGSGSPDSRGDYFAYGSGSKKSHSGNGTPATHRSSISSSLSASSTRSQARSPGGMPTATLSPESALRPMATPLRTRSSINSTISSTTERSPFTGSFADNMHTPTHKRNSTVPTHQLPRSVSPTPSNASMTSTMSRRLSRIPVATPTRFSPGTASASTRNEIIIPGLSVSTSNERTMLAEPSSSVSTRGQDYLARARMGLKTPEPVRPRISATFSALQPRSSAGTPTGPRRTYSSGAIPKTAPAPSSSASARALLSRAPPSSFRVNSPTPSGASVNRPSSRMSMLSYSSAFPTSAAAAALKPFEPSKYDLLDMQVHKILEEVSFELFVARVDQPLRKGQRRREGEEWKGDYVFGAGEKPTGVKLLQIAGSKAGTDKRVKCLVRTGGAWHDLAQVLRARQANVNNNNAESQI